MYYKHIWIVSDATSWSVTLESSFMLLEEVYSTAFKYDHLMDQKCSQYKSQVSTLVTCQVPIPAGKGSTWITFQCPLANIRLIPQNTPVSNVVAFLSGTPVMIIFSY